MRDLRDLGAGARFKQAVADLAETIPADRWYDIRRGQPSSVTRPRVTALLGFDVTDDDGKLLARVKGYVDLYDGTAPEEFVRRVREQLERPSGDDER